MECVNNASSVAAVDQSPGTNRTGSAVPVPCSPTDEVVDVAAAPVDGERNQRDDDIAGRLDQLSLQPLSRCVSGSQTVPARLHPPSDTRNQRSRQRVSLGNVIRCDTGSYTCSACQTASHQLFLINSRAGGRTPASPAGGASRMLRGLMLRMKNIFLVFLMFSKYLWRYSCIMRSTRELEAPRQARSQGWGYDGCVNTPRHAKMVRLVEYR